MKCTLERGVNLYLIIDLQSLLLFVPLVKPRLSLVILHEVNCVIQTISQQISQIQSLLYLCWVKVQNSSCGVTLRVEGVLLLLLAERGSFQRLLMVSGCFNHLAHQIVWQFNFFIKILRRDQSYYILSMRIRRDAIKSYRRSLPFTLYFFFICKTFFQTYDVFLFL